MVSVDENPKTPPCVQGQLEARLAEVTGLPVGSGSGGEGAVAEAAVALFSRDFKFFRRLHAEATTSYEVRALLVASFGAGAFRGRHSA